jgi:hypothetical protein
MLNGNVGRLGKDGICGSVTRGNDGRLPYMDSSDMASKEDATLL